MPARQRRPRSMQRQGSQRPLWLNERWSVTADKWKSLEKKRQGRLAAVGRIEETSDGEDAETRCKQCNSAKTKCRVYTFRAQELYGGLSCGACRRLGVKCTLASSTPTKVSKHKVIKRQVDNRVLKRTIDSPSQRMASERGARSAAERRKQRTDVPATPSQVKAQDAEAGEVEEQDDAEMAAMERHKALMAQKMALLAENARLEKLLADMDEDD